MFSMFIIFENIVLMDFDHYWCIFDRLLTFLKLPEHHCHICFRQYHIDFVFEKKIWNWRWCGHYIELFSSLRRSKQIWMERKAHLDHTRAMQILGSSPPSKQWLPWQHARQAAEVGDLHGPRAMAKLGFET